VEGTDFGVAVGRLGDWAVAESSEVRFLRRFLSSVASCDRFASFPRFRTGKQIVAAHCALTVLTFLAHSTLSLPTLVIVNGLTAGLAEVRLCFPLLRFLHSACHRRPCPAGIEGQATCTIDSRSGRTQRADPFPPSLTSHLPPLPARNRRSTSGVSTTTFPFPSSSGSSAGRACGVRPFLSFSLSFPSFPSFAFTSPSLLGGPRITLLSTSTSNTDFPFPHSPRLILLAIDPRAPFAARRCPPLLRLLRVPQRSLSPVFRH
jgi:hypothetical protein